MKNRTIGLIAAMKDEFLPLLKLAVNTRRETITGFPFYRFSVAGKDACLIESGIGLKNGAKAAGVLIGASSPELILNFGFGGAALPGPAIGDLVIADRILSFKERLFSEQQGLTPALTGELYSALQQRFQGGTYRVHRGTFITTAGITGKGLIAALLPSGAVNPVLEMETSAIARAAAASQIPLVAIRGISDGSDEELDFSMAELTDSAMRIRAHRVFWTVLRKPWVISQMMRLKKNTDLAGRNLAVAVMAMLERL